MTGFKVSGKKYREYIKIRLLTATLKFEYFIVNLLSNIECSLK